MGTIYDFCLLREQCSALDKNGFILKIPLLVNAFYIFLCSKKRDISSVGLERCLDRAEVTGSNPVYLTCYFLK